MVSKVREMAKEEAPKRCDGCIAWVRDERDQMSKAAFGGCARSGKTTSAFGEERYLHYTTDTTSCSLWQPKEA